MDKKVKRLPLLFPIDLQKFSEGELPEEIQVLPVGRWNHPAYGVLTITKEDVSEFKDNFEKGLRKQIPITEGHETFDEKPAVGWFKELMDRGGNGLYATVEWTKQGKTLLSERQYKYFSPEFYSEYEDPETREVHTNVLVGGALTNKPYFKELDAVVLSEKILDTNKLKFNDMDLKELIAKKLEDLSTEEKAFVVENKEKLNEAELETFGSLFEDKPEETPEEKTEETPKETPEDKPEETPEETPEEKVEASEYKMDEKGNVVMSMAQVKALESKANSGFEASEKLKKADVQAQCDKLIFSETNKKGKILPKAEKKVFSFMLALSEEQRKTFSEIMDSIQAKQIFGEKGKGSGAEGSAFAEIEAKTKKLMSEDKSLKYADAIQRVCSENKDLADKYEKDLA